MMNLFKIRRVELLPSAVALIVILFFQYLIISKFFCLFIDYSDESWKVFMRNFHMSGFDPITYSVITDWNFGYDIVRHPLLAFMMYPLYLLNYLLWYLTGINCVQLLTGVVLTFCSFYSFVFFLRLLREIIGVKSKFALLLSAFFFSFAFILVSSIVPDHFCLSLFLLLFVIYVAGIKMKNKQHFSILETVILFVITSGVTLSNGAIVFLAVLFVNGRSFFNKRFLSLAVLLPSILMLGGAIALRFCTDVAMPDASKAITRQMSWVDTSVNKTSIIVENLFGESIQLHRRYVLGDVLTGRPLLVAYSWSIQYAVEAVIVLLFLFGVYAGRKQRFLWLLMSVFGFNVLLHIVLGFAITEVYIMSAHWLFVIPLAMAYLFLSCPRPIKISVSVVLLCFTIYLWAYHSTLLVRYLTWPLKYN